MDYKSKYLKYKSKYLKLKELYGGENGAPDLVKLNGIIPPGPNIKELVNRSCEEGRKLIEPNFVISSHGGQIVKRWEIPSHVNLLFFTEPGKDLTCIRDLQSQVCRKEKVGPFVHSGSRDITRPNYMEYDYELSPDKSDPSDPKFFYSGIVMCKSEVIFRMHPWEDKTILFSDLVNGIVEYCRLAGWPAEQEINITGLFCRGEIPIPPLVNPYDPSISQFIIMSLPFMAVPDIIQSLNTNLRIDLLTASTVVSNTLALNLLIQGLTPYNVYLNINRFGIDETIINESIRLAQETMSSMLSLFNR